MIFPASHHIADPKSGHIWACTPAHPVWSSVCAGGK